MTNQLVEENFDCFKLISKALKRTASEENLLQSPRKGLETRAIVACGGKYTFCSLPDKDEWIRLADGLLERDHLTRWINYRDQLYVFPSEGGKGERYDPVVNGWSTLDLSTGTRSTKVAVVRGEIYAIEVNILTIKSTIKRYDVERCSWQTVLSSHEGCRENPCVVASGNHLYVCGGNVGGEIFSKAERFDTVGNKWEEIANMQQQKWCAFGAASEGKIFLAGGIQERMWSTTCEMYNISSNRWQLLGSLNYLRAFGSMVSLKGTLYVLGGISDPGRSHLSVDCYDPTEDKWNKKTIIPVGKMISRNIKDSYHGLCTETLQRSTRQT